MLENPVELGGFFATQEISFLELCLQTCGKGPLRRQANGARGKIETAGLEARARPRPDVVAGSATRHTYRPARQLRVRRQKINQPRRRRPFFPGHVAGLVTALPVISAHGTQWIGVMERWSIGVLGKSVCNGFRTSQLQHSSTPILE